MSFGSADTLKPDWLSPNDVALWLRRHGFVRQGAAGEHGAVFTREIGGELQEVVLPTSPLSRDFDRRMEELVSDLAEAEHRKPDEVLRDIGTTLPPVAERWWGNRRALRGITLGIVGGILAHLLTSLPVSQLFNIWRY